MTRYDIGVDIGGTFSDIVCIPRDGGDIITAKVPSTPPAFINGVLNALKKAKVNPKDVQFFIHGSTIATNAIIERKGAKTGLVTTDGFRDVLEAARAERPDMYDLRWDPTPPLVSRPNRLGVKERVDYEGTVLEPLDEAAVRRAAELFEKRGIEAVAICFLNAFINPINEQRAKDIVRTILPEAYVCTSAEVFPEIREFERTSTTVVNAYLGPILDHYLKDLTAHVKQWGYDGDVMIVHSGGGMMSCDSARALPARTCNSGPAGGVIGGAYIGALAGFQNVITFDMGGTSADLSLVSRGQPLIQPGSKVEFTVPVRFPCIDLVSIGAGGGSVAWVDTAGTLRNGPQSAGANPGPACYDQGGTEPTNTDANLVLGRIDPENFLGGEMVLRKDLAARAIEAKVAKVFGMSLEQAAEGIIRLANAHMINATRVISVARGYDPRDFALVAFGGAGPLHAVELARDLHIPRVVVPRFPGVTSAFGALRVDVRHDFIQPVFQRESEFNPAALNRIYAELADRARKTLRGEGLADDQMHFTPFADVKYFPQNKYLTMPVPDGPLGEREMRGIVEAYVERYQREFGYTIPTDIAEVEICSARLVASGNTRKAELPRVPEGDARVRPRATRGVYFREAGSFVQTAIYDKTALRPGAALAGPVVIEQMDSSILIPPGASAVVDSYLNVIIDVGKVLSIPSPHRGGQGEGPQERETEEGVMSMATHDTDLRMDPITFEVLRNAFRAICNEGSAVLERVAYAPAITEGRDYSVSMVTADGRFISHGDRDHTPHFGTFEATTRAVLEDVEEFRPGDAYIFSDPYRGGTHNQDIRLVRPVFWNGELFAFMLGLCHWTDVGGPVPGTFNPNATEVYAEGIRLPTMKLYDQGKPVKSTFELLKLNVRVPADRMGDLAAQNQATLTMEARLKELVEKYGAETIKLAFEEVMNYSERLFRRDVAELPDGTYEFEDFLDLDEGKQDHRPIRVHCRLTIKGSEVIIDWSESDPAPIGPQGVTYPAAVSATLDGTLHCFPHLNPLNHGIIRAIQIKTRPGTVTHILPPTPMAGYCAGAYEKMDAATMGAWAQALAAVDPTRISCGIVNLENCVIGGIHPKRKTRFVSYFWMEGGQGARPYKDGPTFQMMIFAGGACNQSLEVAERWYPFRFTRFEAIQDSCGDGKYRGGFGVNKSYRLWGDGVMTVHGDREIITPFGLSGGTNGAANQLILNEDTPQERSMGLRATQVPVKASDHISFKSNGGGGFGDPLERDPQKVLEDYINEFISLQKAQDIYGVAIRAIDPDTLRYEVDEAETARLRQALRARPRREGFGPGEVHPFGARVRVDEDVLKRMAK